jgi:biopolymer transport protein TolR
MSMRPVQTTLRPQKEMNMLPLMDLTFILLITFIITFPLIEQGIPMDLPTADAQPLDEDQSRTISVDTNGVVYLDDIAIDLADLRNDMQLLASVDPEAVVLVRADQNIAYGRVVEVLQILTDAKISRMALVTVPEQQ